MRWTKLFFLFQKYFFFILSMQREALLSNAAMLIAQPNNELVKLSHIKEV